MLPGRTFTPQTCPLLPTWSLSSVNPLHAASTSALCVCQRFSWSLNRLQQALQSYNAKQCLTPLLMTPLLMIPLLMIPLLMQNMSEQSPVVPTNRQPVDSMSGYLGGYLVLLKNCQSDKRSLNGHIPYSAFLSNLVQDKGHVRGVPNDADSGLTFRKDFHCDGW